MTVLKLIAQENYITYNKVLAKQMGLEEAIVLGELCSVSNLYEDNEFYCKQSKICEDTCLSERAVRIAIQHLQEMEVIIVTKKGCPCKNYYKINEEKIIELLENCRTSSVKSDTSRSVKSDTTSTVKSDTTVKEFKKEINKEFKDNTVLPKSEYTTIFDFYLSKYEMLYKRGKLKTEKPFINYAKVSKLIKNLIPKIGVVSILKIIETASNDDWIVQNGFTLSTILSEGVINKLMNGKQQPKNSSYTPYVDRVGNDPNNTDYGDTVIGEDGNPVF